MKAILKTSYNLPFHFSSYPALRAITSENKTRRRAKVIQKLLYFISVLKILLLLGNISPVNVSVDVEVNCCSSTTLS
jgi:hypothetical protein